MTRTFKHIKSLLEGVKQYKNTKEWDFHRAYLTGYITALSNGFTEGLSLEEVETLMKELRRIGGEFIA